MLGQLHGCIFGLGQKHRGRAGCDGQSYRALDDDSCQTRRRGNVKPRLKWRGVNEKIAHEVENLLPFSMPMARGMPGKAIPLTL